MSGERLDSWKEIAAYLKRDVATVRRWEKREGLPVHRHLHQKLGSVYAYTAELDVWLEGRRRQDEAAVRPTPPRMTALAWTLVLVLLAGAAYLLRHAMTPGTDTSARVRIAVHRAGTVASLIAAGLHDVLRRSMPAVAVELVDQPGMMSTLRALDAGTVDVGLAFNLLAFHAVKTADVLGRPSTQITAFTAAYATPAQIVVRRDSPLKTIGDLKGKRVSLGIAESGERFCSRILLSHMGIGAEHVTDHAIDFGPSIEGLKAGRIDAYITWRGLPVPDLTKAFGSGELRLIPLNVESLQGLRVKHPFLVPWVIPARVYTQQDVPVPTVSGRILLLASRSLSADVAEQILHGIAAHIPDLVARHPAAADINVRKRPTLEDGLSIDLHPGAERFFQSVARR